MFLSDTKSINITEVKTGREPGNEVCVTYHHATTVGNPVTIETNTYKRLPTPFFSAVRNIHEINTATKFRYSFEALIRYKCLTHIFQPKVGSSRVFVAFYTIVNVCEIFVSAAIIVNVLSNM